MVGTLILLFGRFSPSPRMTVHYPSRRYAYARSVYFSYRKVAPLGARVMYRMGVRKSKTIKHPSKNFAVSGIRYYTSDTILDPSLSYYYSSAEIACAQVMIFFFNGSILSSEILCKGPATHNPPASFLCRLKIGADIALAPISTS